MKIGNLKITWHRHKWYWHAKKPFKNEFGNYTVEIVKKCDCNCGYYNDVIFIETTVPLSDVYLK